MTTEEPLINAVFNKTIIVKNANDLLNDKDTLHEWFVEMRKLYDKTSREDNMNSSGEDYRKSLRNLWEAYKVYAESCVNSGVWPAPFGTAQDEKELKERWDSSYIL